jgi:Fic family protein
MIVDERRQRELFRHITNRNLLWQYDFLIDSIPFGLPTKHKLDGYTIRALNFFAVINLAESPGEIRDDDVHIAGTDHEPPDRHSVKEHYGEFIPHLHRVWDRWDALRVAAYVPWRINWIHPFLEGNGRTARAAMYYALSIKTGRILKGGQPIPSLMRDDPEPYYTLLRDADRSIGNNSEPDLGPLAEYLGGLLDRQLKS